MSEYDSEEDFNQIEEEPIEEENIIQEKSQSGKLEEAKNGEAPKTGAKPNKMVYKGIEYQKDFGTLIRNLDREQSYKNECMRKAFYKSRDKVLAKIHDKQIAKEMAKISANLSNKQREKEETELWNYYQEIRDEQILKEWKKQGRTARDWVKTKVVFFDENNKPQALATDKYRQMQNDKKKTEMAEAVANSAPKNQKQTQKKFELVKGHIENVLQKFDEHENKDVETDCCMCFNMMIESCQLPCMHRFCIQCMRQHLGYQSTCPLCRASVPEYFRMQYYHHNVDKSFQKVLKQKFPLQYEEQIQDIMRSRLDNSDRFKIEFEIGSFYNGYENPSNVYDYEQKTIKNEWTVFIRAKNPQMRPLISQFISFVDFLIPQANCVKTVNAPEEHYNNVQESKSLYSIQTKLERNKFKLTPQNKSITVDVCIYFNNELASMKAYQKPFLFTMPLNFNQKEQVKDLTISFDQSRIQKIIKVEDFKQKLLNTNQTKVKMTEENMYDIDNNEQGIHHRVR